MGRPRKKGLDYIPLDVHFFDDRRIRKLNTKYSGGKASFVFLRLSTEIFQNGFYLKLTEDDIKFLAYESKIRKDVFRKILADLIENDFFDSQIYEQYGVLTSEDIQRQYFSIKNSSKTVLELTEEDTQYLVIDVEKYKNIRTKQSEISTTYQSKTDENLSQTDIKADEILTENQRKTTDKGTENGRKTALSKEKKSKEKEKGEKSKEPAAENGRKNHTHLSKKEIENFEKEILGRFPDFLRPESEQEREQWLSDYLKLRDKLSHEQISQIVSYGLTDKFWKQNLVSLSYLLKPSTKDGIPIWKKLLTQTTGNTHKPHNPRPVDTTVTVY